MVDLDNVVKSCWFCETVFIFSGHVELIFSGQVEGFGCLNFIFVVACAILLVNKLENRELYRNCDVQCCFGRGFVQSCGGAVLMLRSPM